MMKCFALTFACLTYLSCADGMEVGGDHLIPRAAIAADVRNDRPANGTAAFIKIVL